METIRLANEQAHLVVPERRHLGTFRFSASATTHERNGAQLRHRRPTLTHIPKLISSCWVEMAARIV